MQTVIPQLRMTDADRSLAFYAALGFAVDREHRFDSGMPLFAQLTRDGQTLFLTAHAGGCAVGGAVYFKVVDVDACARAFAAAGVPIMQAPWNTDWGTREMVLIDPDHNRLRFAQHAD
ncbi:glyoxalase [Luteimonas chenhongjianii]|uniref:Bleomycin resistance protein n=1 Tax=Luteimonas chenhongjianii TaxID=2006110 RepID=A0A290XCG6_9GAMM|nr:glyoxalase superfamily protein [Luteimonas chenhongjianii]ATD66646.1 glyoxalase [Luteimonas chenhongjianii]